MKIYELLEAHGYTNDRDSMMPDEHRDAAVRKAQTDPDHERVGAGLNAYVGRSTSPHEMDRVQRISGAADMGATYLNAVRNTPALRKNPFAPRVMQGNIDSNVAQMSVERLHRSISDKISGNPDLMKSLWDRYFTTPWPNVEDSVRISNRMAKLLDDAVEDPSNMEFIRDPNLAELLNSIRELGAEHGRHADIHRDNIMWRITGNMPQLVITDPLN